MDRYLQQASPHDRDVLSDLMNELQLKEMQTMFNMLTQKCFTKCINNFRARNLDSSEKNCINICAEKYLAHMGRVGQRFHEESLMNQQQQQQSQQ
jgi:import inner membrane translocase subunit TIM9